MTIKDKLSIVVPDPDALEAELEAASIKPDFEIKPLTCVVLPGVLRELNEAEYLEYDSKEPNLD